MKCLNCKYFIPEKNKFPEFIKRGGIGYCQRFEKSDPDSAYIFKQFKIPCRDLLFESKNIVRPEVIKIINKNIKKNKKFLKFMKDY